VTHSRFPAFWRSAGNLEDVSPWRLAQILVFVDKKARPMKSPIEKKCLEVILILFLSFLLPTGRLSAREMEEVENLGWRNLDGHVLILSHFLLPNLCYSSKIGREKRDF